MSQGTQRGRHHRPLSIAKRPAALGPGDPHPKRNIPMMQTTDRIRELNDALRKDLTTGLALITPGVMALGAAAVERIVKTIAAFDDFYHANDPHQEHDFGAFDADGATIFFKIDYYDRSLSLASPDPSD